MWLNSECMHILTNMKSFNKCKTNWFWYIKKLKKRDYHMGYIKNDTSKLFAFIT